MPTKPENIFIVQTAESSRNGRPKGGNISLINKQSALYKYRQQKEQKDSRSSLSLAQTSAPRNSATHRSSWLLESRLSRPTSSSDDALTDGDGSSPEEEQLFVTFREDRPWINEWEFDTDEDARLHNCYAGLRTDPFHAMPIHESSVVLSSSDLYINTMVPHLSAHARVVNLQDIYLDIFWQMVFQEETIDTAVAMTHCADATWRSGHGFVPNKSLFVHHGRALAKLSQSLSNSGVTNTGILVSILMYNCNIARFLGNFQAAKRHMSMLRHLLKDDHSLESLGYQGKLKHLFLQLEYFFTLNNGEEPLVKRIPYESKYPSLPLNDEMSKLVNTLPTGFQKLARSGQLSSQVVQLLGRAQEMVAAVANGTATAWLAKPNENPYSNYREALPCLDATDGEKQHLEKLICYAIFLLTSRLLSPVKSAIWSLPTSGGRAQITQQALNCRADTNAEKHCLIWLWLMCIDAWGIVSGTMPVRGQILMQQLKARYPEAENWRHLSRVTKEFFWTEDLEAACKGYWKSEQ